MLVQILKEYQLEYLVGYLVSDNALNSDSCVDALLHIIHLDMNPTRHIQRCLHCYGHIFNLAAKAFLWGTNVQSFERDINVQTTLQNDQEKLKLWQKKGLMGKLHNIVTYI